MDSPEERQEQEVEALKAIYEDDFQDLRTLDIWKIRRPPEFLLNVYPQHNSKGQLNTHCFAQLHVKMSLEYPLTKPALLELDGVKGVPEKAVKVFTAQLKKAAETELLGDEMIMELVQRTSIFLDSFNKPSFSSFYEEMEARKKV